MDATSTTNTFQNFSYGHGKFTSLADGNGYEGEWKNGKKHGKGSNYDKDGQRYEGEWKN